MPPKPKNLERHPEGITVQWIEGGNGRIHHFEVWVEQHTKKQFIKCDLCQLPLALIGKDTLSTATMTSHRGLRNCTGEQKRSGQRKHRSEANRALAELFGKGPLANSTPASLRAPSSHPNMTTPTSLGTPSSQPIATASLIDSPLFTALRSQASWDSSPSQSGSSTPRYQSAGANSSTPGTSVDRGSSTPYSREQSTVQAPRTKVIRSEQLPPSSPTSSYGDGPGADADHNPFDGASSLSSGCSSDDPELDDTLPESEDAQETCKGQSIWWSSGSVWETYPYELHADSQFPFRLLEIKENGRMIVVQSTRCRVRLKVNEVMRGACSRCSHLGSSSRIRVLMERAAKKDLPSHTPYKYLSHAQKIRLMHRLNEQNKKLRLENLNLKRRVTALTNSARMTQKMLVYISQNKIPAVSRILKQSIRRRESAEYLLNKLVLAASGKYRACAEWSDYELDVANLIRLEGGPRLLYALSRSDGYPSKTTLRRRKPLPELMASLAFPIAKEMSHNVREFYGPSGRKPPPNPGVGQALMADDIALEEAPRYCTIRNSILGVCREHAPGNLEVNSMEDIHNMESNLKDGICHHGKAATVIALAPVTGRENYFPSPLLASPTCAKEKWQRLVEWLELFIKTWDADEYGAVLHGKITVVATDGAAVFRKARHELFHKKVIDLESPLGRKLSRLEGLNLHTGENGMLGTCDFKHIMKRFSTWIRSSTGIQLGDTVIQSRHVFEALLTLDKRSPADVEALLNPKDKQNVPAAVKLIEALLEIDPKIPNTSASLQAVTKRLPEIAFIAQLLGYFLRPFTDVKMSLSDQIRSLSTYSHLLTALYRRHGSAFMNGALYADSQAIVKNIIFTAARLKILDKDMEYFIILDGTDRLEGVFGTARTQDHGRNFDILQLAHKLSIGAEINAIYERHARLSMGHRRLKLINVSGIDHTNPVSWIGDVVLRNLRLRKEYAAGAEIARMLLEVRFGEPVDFSQIFSKPNIDHLRPTGVWVGTRVEDKEPEDKDISQVIDSLTGSASSSTVVSVEMQTDAQEDHQSGDEGEDDPTSLDPAEEIGTESESEDADADPAIGAQGTLFADEDAAAEEADSQASINPLHPVSKSNSYLVDEAGVQRSKHTLVAQYLVTSDAARKLVTRTFRVRGDTLEGTEHARKKRRDQLNAMNEQREGNTSMGDPGAILVRTGTDIAIAVVDVLNFRKLKAKTNLYSISEADLGAAGTTVAVQFLKLEPVQKDEKLEWRWDGNYLQIQHSGDQPKTAKHFATRVRGKEFRSITPRGPSLEGDADQCMGWIFDHEMLKSTMEDMWANLNPEKNEILSNIQALLEIDGSIASLPLTFSPTGSEHVHSLHVHNPPSILSPEATQSITKSLPCKLCLKSEPLARMRNHVGKHILWSLRGQPDPSLRPDIEVGLHPCGWCGRSDSGCRTEMEAPSKGKKAPKLYSTCEYAYTTLVYSSAATSNKTTASTNLPIHCSMCEKSANGHHPTIWKYNFYHHLAQHHVDPVTNSLTDIPASMLSTVRLSKFEETCLGVREDLLERFRRENNVDNTSVAGGDDHEPANLTEVTPQGGSRAPGRKRGTSDVSVEEK
ncbi:hypothetical protein FA13DRAFT_1695305 [Coprinellus micaceus]|uniref:Uncharacterized protein n=1 Tax=Coprinellus micaceus TaxID=71717 RepID=A0A4Y7SL43_COPMI|nr:hypothetical protein FA13DRAFT_1695305 [Coprinellus micaceus]